ncbi:hypothetical protein ALC60_03310 [Trachymyrmex zeteki]|uniref:uncharacterized protein n=1 Tax=Mycetomoellerius zeteki TaxID=64791 RepID=UPI00084EAA5A|nr:PREDICTED: uncharacterized protein LOC108720150 [Trachymyrmex zeteki]KYQ53645.1 hypothetical protein ALC60_03310 [Trachymyrmex zeteki]
MAPPTVEELQEQLAQLQAAFQQGRGPVGNVAHIDSYRIPKIPPFLIKDPVIWFIQVEATFEAARITDQKTKAHHVVMTLDAEAIACCRDLIAEPDENEPYSKLKARIIENFSVSAESQLRQLIKGQVLTSGKPSQILGRLRNLNPDKRCDDAVLKTIFFEYLSPYVRGILATTECADLDRLAKMADKITETAADSVQCAAASVKAAQPTDLESKIDKLAADLTTLAAEVKRSSRPRVKGGPDKDRKRSESRRPSVCWPHRTFGDQARACNGTDKSPCTWPKPKAIADGKAGE